MKIKNYLIFSFIFISNAIAFKINNTYIKLDLLFSVFLFFLLLKKFDFKLKYISLLICLYFLIGLFTSLRYNDNTSGVLLNFILILFFLLLFRNIINYFSFESLFKSYILAAKFCVFFGFIQIISFLISLQFQSDFFLYIYDPRWLFVSSPISYAGVFPKISSFFTEPSYLSCFLLPYLIISINNAKVNTYGYLTLFFVASVFVFTFSTIGFISLFLFFVSRFSNLRFFGSLSNYFFLGLIIFFVISNDSMFLRITQLGESNLDSINLSSMVYILNLNLIISSFNWQYLIGYGLDSYQILIGNLHESSMISDSILKLYTKSDLMLNGSPTLFFRFFVEFGILGYLFILKNFKLVFLKSPFFFGFLAYCLRSGEYLRFDTLFFLLMFLFFHSGSQEFKYNYKTKNQTNL